MPQKQQIISELITKFKRNIDEYRNPKFNEILLLTANYLISCKKILERRERGKWKGKFWYGYSRSQALQIMENEKILTADLNPFANFTIEVKGKYTFPGGAGGGYGILTNLIIFTYWDY